MLYILVGSVVEWLVRRDCDRHGPGSKPTRPILLCPWERCFTALSPAWCFKLKSYLLNYKRTAIS